MISRELLHNTLSIQTTSGNVTAMNRFITRFVHKVPNTQIVYHAGNIYVTKGEADIYPCVIAHTDTVHPIIDEFVVNVNSGVYSAKNRRTNAQHGVGGDDKVGIAIALHALKTYDTIKVAFFRDEEVGCVGSGLALLDFFSDCAFVAQSDRRGNDEIVRSIYGTDLYNEEFSTAIRPIVSDHKFTETEGALTDVYALRKLGMNLACFNICSGYYQPHMSTETVKYDDVANTTETIGQMIEQLSYRQWKMPNARTTRYSLVPYTYYFEEEEEEDEDDVIEADFVAINETIDGETCPHCKEDATSFDDSVGLYFCWICADYFGMVQEEIALA